MFLIKQLISAAGIIRINNSIFLKHFESKGVEFDVKYVQKNNRPSS
jgi:hypothetical protein